MPLTEQLNRLNTGYEEHTMKTKISHLLYIDDMKLIAKSVKELQKQKQTVKTFSDDIHMEFIYLFIYLFCSIDPTSLGSSPNSI
jgi:hypothetical protein